MLLFLFFWTLFRNVFSDDIGSCSFSNSSNLTTVIPEFSAPQIFLYFREFCKQFSCSYAFHYSEDIWWWIFGCRINKKMHRISVCSYRIGYCTSFQFLTESIWKKRFFLCEVAFSFCASHELLCDTLFHRLYGLHEKLAYPLFTAGMFIPNCTAHPHRKQWEIQALKR